VRLRRLPAAKGETRFSCLRSNLGVLRSVRPLPDELEGRGMDRG